MALENKSIPHFQNFGAQPKTSWASGRMMIKLMGKCVGLYYIKYIDA